MGSYPNGVRLFTDPTRKRKPIIAHVNEVSAIQAPRDYETWINNALNLTNDVVDGGTLADAFRIIATNGLDDNFAPVESPRRNMRTGFADSVGSTDPSNGKQTLLMSIGDWKMTLGSTRLSAPCNWDISSICKCADLEWLIQNHRLIRRMKGTIRRGTWIHVVQK